MLNYQRVIATKKNNHVGDDNNDNNDHQRILYDNISLTSVGDGLIHR